MARETDTLTLQYRLTGAIDGLRDLLARMNPDEEAPKGIGYILEMIGELAHELHDEHFGPRPPRANND